MVDENNKPIFGAPRRKADAPPAPELGGDVREAMKRVDESLSEVEGAADAVVAEVITQQSKPTTHDPAPTATNVAQERAFQIVDNISMGANEELRGLRDQIDELMRDVTERRELIKEAIRAHAEYAETTIAAKEIIGDHVKKLRATFNASKTMLPPPRNV